MPKCEIFDRSDFHYFYTRKPFWVDDFVVKILLIILIFGEPGLIYIVSDAQAEHTRKELMRTLSMRSVPYAHAQYTHQSLRRMLSMV